MFVYKSLMVLLPLYVICVEQGPRYRPTEGEVWPKPQHQVTKNTYYVLRTDSGTFRVTKHYTCHILEEGIKRLLRLNFARRRKYLRGKQYKGKHYNRNLTDIFDSKTEFIIELTAECEEYPYLGMDEKYELTVGQIIVLSSASIWGILRGMETFNHLFYYSDDYTEIRINATTIKDYPAYPHRGLLIDTARHYLQLKTILMIIDAMEMNKMNVLHWHVVDDESFPYQSERLPYLSMRAAYHPSMVYTKQIIRVVIERARLAGIRVIPEFDAPGHVRSWGVAYPEILTKCYDENDEVVAVGSLDPVPNTTHTILKQLYEEVTDLFPDEYIHLGGDEVDIQCWLSNLKIHMLKRQIRVRQSRMPYVLRKAFIDAVRTMLPPKSKYILWQDVFDTEVVLPKKTIIQVWRKGPIKEMLTVLKSGYRVLFSSSWYLDNVADTWDILYSADPRHMVYNHTQTRLSEDKLKDILGGEACMWGEFVDDSNVLNRIWPRASAVAERLWTGIDLNTVSINATNYTRRRMEEHVCRMRHRDIPAEPPNGPGFCVGPVLKLSNK